MRRKPRGSSKWPAVVFFLTRAPRTPGELSELAQTKAESVSKILRLLEAEGLVRKTTQRRRDDGRSGRHPMQWEWAA